jgi:exodeoxyribonuclease VIII
MQEQPILETHNWAPISDNLYHSLPILSAHGLMHCLKSYNHYLASKVLRDESTSMAFGRMAHLMAFDEHALSKFSIEPVVDRRTKEGKQVYYEFLNTLRPGFTAVKTDDYRRLEAMQEKLREAKTHKELGRYFDDIIFIEHHAIRAFAETETGPIYMKAKPDAVGKGFILDYKTTQDAWIWGFQRSAKNYKYDLQLRVYQRMHELMHGELLEMVILAQETEPPFEWQFYRIPNDTNQETDKIISIALQKYYQGVQGHSAGYPREMIDLDLVRSFLP